MGFLIITIMVLKLIVIRLVITKHFIVIIVVKPGSFSLSIIQQREVVPD